MALEAALEIDINTLKKCLTGFKSRNLLVIGDLILDEFIWGRVRRISPEAPVPVVEVEREELRLGGSANVVNNLISLGCRVSLCGVVGEDDNGKKLSDIMRGMNVDCRGVVLKKDRPTAIKTRVIAQHQQIVRFDREKPAPISDYSRNKIINFVKKDMTDIDAVIISDYGKGVISKELLSEIIPFINERNIPIAVDPKPVNFTFYQGVTVITPNHHEAAEAAGMDTETKENVNNAGMALLESNRTDAILITRGENGMSLFERNGQITHLPTKAREVYDVSGAGDTVISVLALSLASGANLKQAAVIANHAAGIVVGKLGTTPANIDELAEDLGVNL